jgi:hypothetical protein
VEIPYAESLLFLAPLWLEQADTGNAKNKQQRKAEERCDSILRPQGMLTEAATDCGMSSHFPGSSNPDLLVIHEG